MTIPYRRTAAVTLGITALAAASFTSCSRAPDYGAVCVDQTTQQRVDDDRCDDGTGHVRGGGAAWYFMRRGTRFPAVGQPVSGGSFTAPGPGAEVRRGGYGAKAGAVERGGFGGRFGRVGS